MNAQQLAGRARRGLKWHGAAGSLVGVLDFAGVVIVLALWVTPEQYGAVALAMMFFPVLDVAGDLGLSAAVIQRDDHSPERIATVFWMCLGTSLALCGLLALFAPRWAALHGQPAIGAMLLAWGGKLVFQNCYLIPQALLRRDLRFRELATVRIVANLVELAAKLGLAALGAGLWCFVGARLCNVLCTGLGTQWCRPWRPALTFRPRAAAAWARFGLSTSASQLLFHLYTNADYAVVSLWFGRAATGLYKIAYELALEPVRMLTNTVGEVAFPVLARLRTDRAALIEQFVTFSRVSLAAVLPFVALILAGADEILVLAWGPVWADAAGAARLLCLVGALRAFSAVIPPLLDGIGRPGLTLAYMSTASIVVPACLVAAAAMLGGRLGWTSVAVGWAVGYPIAVAVLLWLSLRELELSLGGWLTGVAAVPACVSVALVGATAAGWLAALVVPATPLLRLAVVAGVLAGSVALLYRHKLAVPIVAGRA